MNQPKVPLSRGKKIRYSLIMLFLALIVAEMSVRCYTYATGRGFLDNPETFRSHFFTNSVPPPPMIKKDGFVFQKVEVPRVKAAGEIRILCLGGSTTQGFKIKSSFPEQLDKLIQQQHLPYPVTVMNAGAASYTTAHSLVNFSLRCLDASPDIVIVYHSVNDLRVNYVGDFVQPDYSNAFLQSGQLAYIHRTGLNAELMRMSRLARIIEIDILRLRPPIEDAAPDANYHEGLRYFQRNLRSIIAVAREQGVSIVLAPEAARSDFRKRPDFQAYTATVKNVAKQAGVPLVDVTAAISDDHLFFDFCHNTDDGVKQVAAVFLPQVMELIKERHLAASGK